MNGFRTLLMAGKNEEKNLEKRSFGAPTLLYAFKRELGGFDTLKCLAVLVETVSANLCVFRWPQDLLAQTCVLLGSHSSPERFPRFVWTSPVSEQNAR